MHRKLGENRVMALVNEESQAQKLLAGWMLTLGPSPVTRTLLLLNGTVRNRASKDQLRTELSRCLGWHALVSRMTPKCVLQDATRSLWTVGPRYG